MLPKIANSPLVIQLMEWLVAQPRTYSETMAAWRTSCPKLAIWEDAGEAKLIDYDANKSQFVRITKIGAEYYKQETGRILENVV